MSEQVSVVIEGVNVASAGEVVSAFAQEVVLWQQIDAELTILERSKRKLAKLFAELKQLVLARGGKRTKGEQQQQSWAKAIAERGLKVRTVDDWIAREAAGWPNQWPPKTDPLEPEAEPDADETEPQLADSANCPDAEASPGSDELADDVCEFVPRLLLTVEKRAKFVAALDKLVGFGGSRNRVEALYEAVLYAADTVRIGEDSGPSSGPFLDATSGSPEAEEAIQ